MKKRLFYLVFFLGFVFFSIFGLASCDVVTNEPTKLQTPNVVLEGNVASWSANSDADKFEISLDGKLSYVENTYTSETLTAGQSLKVRAVGDGVKFVTSDWSNTVKYEGETHTCNFTGEWKVDATHHWKECSCGQIDGKVAHSGGTATETKQAECEVCGTLYGELKAPDHTHEPTGDWKYDDTHHWKECVCGAPDTKVAHSGGTATTTEKAKCEVCGTPYGELKAPEHQCSYTELKHDATNHWYACDCGEVKPNSLEGHKGGTATATEKAKCEVCGEPYGELKTPETTVAPTYLSITASKKAPTPETYNEHFKLMANNGSVTISEALEAFFADSNNSLGDTTPSSSEYEIYSYSGQTVYIQIWLNNPDQNTILSLKLNGTKYQTGGALQSFFVEYENSYLNCVYVAVQIPANTYLETSYEVTEIEYVEGSNISQEGKAVLIDEDNDTVTIGLPYEASVPVIKHGDTPSTGSSIALTITVSDNDDYLAVSGGWLRAVIYDTNYNILGQSKLVAGENEVLFTGLNADTWYMISTVLYVDGRAGYGVYPNIMHTTFSSTNSAITVDVTSETLLNETTGKYYPVIKVDAVLEDSFTFSRIELYEGYDEEAIYTSDFGGYIEISEYLLSGRNYRVKIYYTSSSGVEQNYEYYTYTDTMYAPSVWYSYNNSMGLLDDAVLGFEFSEDKCNLDNLKIQVWYEKSAQYIAEDVLYLLDNPNAIDDLRAELETIDPRDLAWRDLSNRIDELENALRYVQDYYSEFTRQDWENEAAKGKYLYEFVYGEDEEFFKGANNYYYVILKDYQSKRITSDSWEFTMTAEVDYNDGSTPELRQLCHEWFEISPLLSEDDFIFTDYDEDYNELFKIDENNVVYLKVMSRTGSGDESYNAIGYVNQIALFKDGEFVKTLWSQEEPNHNIDEEAWLEEIKAAAIAGTDLKEALPLGQLEPITFDLDDVDLSSLVPGLYTIKYTYKMFGKTYDDDNPYDLDGGGIDYKVFGNLPLASINISSEIYNYGEFQIVIPESLNSGRWNYYTIEVRDENQELVGTYDMDTHWNINLLANYSMRIKLNADPYDSYLDYYLEGEWSEWFYCYPVTLDTPIINSQYYEETGVRVEWDYVDGVEKFIYKINGGEEKETTDLFVSGLKDGDKVVVKAVPSVESGYIQSEYSEEFIIIDNRTQLDKPIVSIESKVLVWQAVEYAQSYQIIDVATNEVYRTTSGTSMRVVSGNTYIIKAIPSDYENYKASESDPITMISTDK